MDLSLTPQSDYTLRRTRKAAEMPIPMPCMQLAQWVIVMEPIEPGDSKVESALPSREKQRSHFTQGQVDFSHIFSSVFFKASDFFFKGKIQVLALSFRNTSWACFSIPSPSCMSSTPCFVAGWGFTYMVALTIIEWVWEDIFLQPFFYFLFFSFPFLSLSFLPSFFFRDQVSVCNQE